VFGTSSATDNTIDNIPYSQNENISSNTRKGYFFSKTLYSEYSNFYNAFYFNLNKFGFFKSSETTTNDLHIYFWLYNYKVSQDTVHVSYCPLSSCTQFSEFTDLSLLTVAALSFKEVKIIIKSKTTSSFDVTVDSSQTVTLSLTDFTFRVNSNEDEIGATNFRFYLSK
jgi:hypothetical protein